MTITVNTANVTLELDGDDADERARVAQGLLRALNELEFDVEAKTATGQLPSGAKSGQALVFGQLLLALAPVVVPKLIEFLQAWCLRNREQRVRIKTKIGDREVELEFPPGGMPPADLQKLLKDVYAVTAGTN
jgi:hypothetical protein